MNDILIHIFNALSSKEEVTLNYTVNGEIFTTTISYNTSVGYLCGLLDNAENIEIV